MPNIYEIMFSANISGIYVNYSEINSQNYEYSF